MTNLKKPVSTNSTKTTVSKMEIPRQYFFSLLSRFFHAGNRAVSISFAGYNSLRSRKLTIGQSRYARTNPSTIGMMMDNSPSRLFFKELP